jgi:hypothetical protein
MEKEPEILLDIVAPTPGQQRILDLLAKMIAGGFILWHTAEELIAEINRHRTPKSSMAVATIT